MQKKLQKPKEMRKKTQKLKFEKTRRKDKGKNKEVKKK